jgi:hypothetical protein
VTRRVYRYTGRALGIVNGQPTASLLYQGWRVVADPEGVARALDSRSPVVVTLPSGVTRTVDPADLREVE